MAQVISYTFDEAAGAASAEDAAGSNDHPGTFFGDATTDGSGNAVFDGSGDHLEVAPSPDLGLDQGTIVMSFTAQDKGNSDWHTLFSVDSSGYDGGGHLTIRLTPSGSINVRHQTDSQSFEYWGGPITFGAETTVAYSWSSDGSSLVINGTEVDSGTVPLTLAGDVEPVVIGSSQVYSSDGVANSLNDYFYGEIHQVQLHDQPVTGMAPVLCFAADTLIDTDRGPRPAGQLVPGERVVTRDAGACPILAVNQRMVNFATLTAMPHLRPIVIAPDALGNRRRLRLSRQHCLALRLADGRDVLVRALHLARAGVPGIRIARHAQRITYVHLLLSGHYLVRAEGIWCETLWPGSVDAERVRQETDPGRPPHCLPVLTAAEAMPILRAGRWQPLPTDRVRSLV